MPVRSSFPPVVRLLLLTVPGAGTGIIGELLFDGIVSTAPAPGLVPLIGGAEMISFAPKGFCWFCIGEP